MLFLFDSGVEHPHTLHHHDSHSPQHINNDRDGSFHEREREREDIGGSQREFSGVMVVMIGFVLGVRIPRRVSRNITEAVSWLCDGMYFFLARAYVVTSRIIE